MSTTPTTPAPSKELTPIGQICVTLDKMEGSIADALKGTGISVTRFLATAKTGIQTHPDADKLAKADRQSLYLAVKRAASDGLMPDGREAALVCYFNKDKKAYDVQYQPMVQGMVKLATNSGEIEAIGAYIVYEKDKFSYRAGIDPIPVHEAENWFSDRGDPVGVWGFVKLKNGNYLKPTLLPKERVLRIATRSKRASQYDPKAGPDWEEFWQKAAIRNVLKYAPRSSLLDKMLDADSSEFDMQSEDVYLNAKPTGAVDASGKRETRAASIVKNTAQGCPGSRSGRRGYPRWGFRCRTGRKSATAGGRNRRGVS
jgi:recombination protein RecT